MKKSRWLQQLATAMGTIVEPKKGLPMDKTFGECFGGFRRALQIETVQTPRQIWEWYLKDVDFNETFLRELIDLPCGLALAKLSFLKTWLHNNAAWLTDDWYKLVDLETIAGYPKMVDRALVDDPREWLTQKVDSVYNRTWWKDQFLRVFNQFAASPTSPDITFDNYVKNRWLWSTQGSSKFSNLYLNGDKVKSKFASAVSLSDQELHDIVHNRVYKGIDSNMINIFLKPDEKGFKRRMIANVSLRPYIVGSYIRDFFERRFPSTCPFLNWEFDEDKINMITQLLRDGWFLVPLDESGFDHHFTRECWLGFFDFLDYFPMKDAVANFRDFFDNAYWKFGKEKGQWLKGMPSGLPLTSFLNSLVNYIKQTVLVDSPINYASGDDALFAQKKEINLEELSKKYSLFGSEVHPLKNWISNKYGEYLKELYSKNGVLAYPSRIYSSLIWGEKTLEEDPIKRLFTLAQLWKEYYDRTARKVDLKVVTADIARAVRRTLGWNKKMVENWFTGNPVDGGFGYFNGFYSSFAFKFEFDVKRSEFRGGLIDLPPETKLFNIKCKIRKLVPAFKPYKVGHPVLTPVKSLHDWQERINMESYPVKDRYKHMYMDVVPLPRLPLISDSFLSGFAQRRSMYVCRNLHGSFDSVRARLRMMNLDLINLVVKYKVLHDFSFIV